MRYHFTPTRIAIIKKKLDNNKCWQECGELLLVGMKNGAVKNGLAVLQKVKHTITVWSSDSTPRYIPKRIENEKSVTCIWIFVAALFTTAKRWKQPKCPNRRLGEQNVVLWNITHP